MSDDIFTKEEIDAKRHVTYRDAGRNSKWIRTCDAKDKRITDLETQLAEQDEKHKAFYLHTREAVTGLEIHLSESKLEVDRLNISMSEAAKDLQRNFDCRQELETQLADSIRKGRDLCNAYGSLLVESHDWKKVYESQQWQPIERAPKDGTLFFAYDEYHDEAMYECRWRKEHDMFWCEHIGEVNPQNWQPLPAGPTKTLDNKS